MRILLKIVSFLPSGNGANVIHDQLADAFPEYSLFSYPPRLEYLPFTIPFIAGERCRQADLIHASMDNGLFFYRKRAPLVVTAHNYVLDTYMRDFSTPLQRLHYATDLRFFTRTTLRLATCIVCVSEFVADLLRERYPVSDRIRVIRNGVDHLRFVPPATPPDRGTFRVLFSGNPTRRKGAHWLADIASRLDPGIEIHYTPGLRDSSSVPQRENLLPTGRVAHDEMPYLYGRYHALLAPTVREGFGLGVAEAMACGLPVVASDCSFIPELVENDRGGYLCPVGDCQSYADGINRLASSPDSCLEMGTFNRARIEQSFRLDTMLKSYRKLFLEMLQAPNQT
jgi:glycosyltransferase involved in cell wall biosynthesis